MAWTPQTRRLFVRLALLFAVAQVIVVAGYVFALPSMREFSPGPTLILFVLLLDLGALVALASWMMRAAPAAGVERLAEDVQRIADGDAHHRVGEHHRPDLNSIRESVNRLADVLIHNQELLAENVASLEQTNIELVEARDEIVRQARLASVGTLAAGIAHEVGNPLGAITGFVDVAISRAKRDGADPEILESIRDEAKRIDRIVRGLLDYARPPTDGNAPMPAAAVLDRVRGLLETQGKLDHLETEWELDDREPHIVVEPHRLEQVLINLILNAVHAVRDRDPGRIAVRLYGEEGEIARLPIRREDDPPGINYKHRRRVGSPATSHSVSIAERVTVIEVADNGPGIPAKDLERLFDPFFTTKEPGEGTGLGLSICDKLVDGMSGRIDVESLPDQGARFLIRLPATRRGREPAKESQET